MPCDDKGFTLLELILVMLIVSFSLVALAPALEQVIARQRLENSAEMMGWCCVPPSKKRFIPDRARWCASIIPTIPI